MNPSEPLMEISREDPHFDTRLADHQVKQYRRTGDEPYISITGHFKITADLRERLAKLENQTTSPDHYKMKLRPGEVAPHMTGHQEAKATAETIIRNLLTEHPPGFVVMILRALHRIQRSTKDLTIYKTQEKQ